MEVAKKDIRMRNRSRKILLVLTLAGLAIPFWSGLLNAAPGDVPPTIEPVTPKETPVDTGSETPVTQAPVDTGSETPVAQVPDDAGTDEPVTQAPVDTGSEAPVAQVPDDAGADEPVTQTPDDTGSETPVTQVPDDTGADEPVTQAPVDTGSETPVAQVPDDAGADEPVTQTPDDTGSDTPVVPETPAPVEPAPAAAGKEINSTFSGLWFDPSRDGEGFTIVVSGSTIVVSYYTYDNQKQTIFLIGSQSLASAATSVSIPVVITGGTNFGDSFNPAHVQRTPAGTLSFTFTTCNNGIVDYNLNTLGSGSLSIVRLAGVESLDCF
jgi:hypothetical protein